MFCSNCGKKLEVEAAFCSGCGKAVQENEVQAATSTNASIAIPAIDAKWRNGIVVAAIIIIAAIMFFIVLGNRGELSGTWVQDN